MASIRKIEGKMGTSYKITVTAGRDSQGKQIRHYKTWVPDHPMTAKQMEKEARQVAFEFEREIEHGIQADSKQTFLEYAQYVQELKKQQGNAPTTLQKYPPVLRAVAPYIGHMKMGDIRPQHLNNMYRQLQEETREIKAIAKIDFSSYFTQHGLTRNGFARESGVHPSLIGFLLHGESVTPRTARLVAACLGLDVKELFTITEDKVHTATYVHWIHNYMSIIFSQAEREMLIPFNPAKRATPPPGYQSRPTCLQPEQVQEMLAALAEEPIQLRAMLHLFIVSGCRRGEILALKWPKIDFEGRRMLIDRGISYTRATGILDGPTKTRNARYIMLPEETTELLREYRIWQAEQRLLLGDSWEGTDYVFTSESGGALIPCAVNYRLAAFCKRHGFPVITPHVFRHTAASILISQGIDIVTVAKTLGHKKVSTTTDIYSHVIEEAQRNAAETVADVILRKKRA